MFKYRSKCRWNLLLYINNSVVEIRPDEEFLSSHIVESKYLELKEEPEAPKKIKKQKEDVNESLNNS